MDWRLGAEVSLMGERLTLGECGPWGGCGAGRLLLDRGVGRPGCQSSFVNPFLWGLLFMGGGGTGLEMDVRALLGWALRGEH